MPLYERHIFVCNNRRDPANPRGCCAARGGDALRDALKAELRKAGLSVSIRTNAAGCLDQCEHGPVLVVYPEQVWYCGVQPADLPEIVAEHLAAGRPVERLRLADDCINNPRCPHRAPPT